MLNCCNLPFLALKIEGVQQGSSSETYQIQVVAKVAREAHRREGSLVEQLQAAIASDKMLLRLPDLDMLLETLEEKKHSLQQREQENNLELLLHFLNHSKCVTLHT